MLASQVAARMASLCTQFPNLPFSFGLIPYCLVLMAGALIARGFAAVLASVGGHSVTSPSPLLVAGAPAGVSLLVAGASSAAVFYSSFQTVVHLRLSPPPVVVCRHSCPPSALAVSSPPRGVRPFIYLFIIYL